MFDFVRRKLGAAAGMFLGRSGADGAWTLDFDAAIGALTEPGGKPRLILGTAFSFVHLLDALVEKIYVCSFRRVASAGDRRLQGRSRTMPKGRLHQLITQRLGVSAENIIANTG